jgi:lipopolysaccharide export system protein LptA
MPRTLILLISLLLGFTTAQARQSDSEQPCHITSDSATFHQATNTVEFFGHVVSTQGTSRSWSDYAKGLGDSSGRITRIILTGKPAKYTTQSDDDNYPILASADTIIDYPDKDLVYLEGHALAHHGTDSIKGDKIWYNRRNGTIKSVALADKPTKTVFTIQQKRK